MKLRNTVIAGLAAAAFSASGAVAADLQALEAQINELQKQIQMLKEQQDKVEEKQKAAEEDQRGIKQILSRAQQKYIRDKIDFSVEMTTYVEQQKYKDVRGIDHKALELFTEAPQAMWNAEQADNSAAAPTGAFQALTFGDMAYLSQHVAPEDMLADWFGVGMGADPGTPEGITGLNMFMQMATQIDNMEPKAQEEYAQMFSTVLGGMPMTVNGIKGFVALADANADGLTTPAEFQNYLATNSPGAGAPTYMTTMMANIAAPYDRLDTWSPDNDSLLKNKLRLKLAGAPNEHLNFGATLSMYKAFGDDAGVKWMNGTPGSMGFDGVASSSPDGADLEVERAFVTTHFRTGPIPGHFSFGRRPANFGAPTEVKDGYPVSGSPLAQIINWEFDGFSYQLNLGDWIMEASDYETLIPGLYFKLCYGQGFENMNGNALSATNGSAVPDLNDVNMLGFILQAWNDDQYKVIANYARAMEVTDGFSGTTVLPYNVDYEDTDRDNELSYGDKIKDVEINEDGYISRVEPTKHLGDIDMLSLLVQGNNFNLDWFINYGWSKSNPNGEYSRNPYAMMTGKVGLLNDIDFNADGSVDYSSLNESHTGDSIYLGAAYNFQDFDGRLGLEYNWGSKYWMSFSGAADDTLGSKLATRGEVWEAYYNHRFWDHLQVQLGAQMYDYKYTGSGSQLGEPVEINDEMAFADTFMPAVDKAQNYYLKFMFRY